MFANLLKLPRTVWLLGLVSLFNDATSELIYPLVPIYLASVLMAGPRALGIIEGICEATSSILKLVSGILSDRRRSSKPWVVGGYALAAIARPLLAFAASWPVVLALRFADRVGKGLRSSPRDALLARSVKPGERGLAFGFHRAMDNAGAVVGPLLAAGLLAAEVPLRTIFLWTALGGALTVALALAIREPVDSDPAPPATDAWKLRQLPIPFKRYLVVLALFTLGNSSNMFLLLRARELGLAEYQVPLLWALVSLSAALFSTPLSALSDKLGRNRLIVAGWGVYGAFYILLGLNREALLLWPLFAFYGLFMAATEGAEKALAADLVDRQTLGTAYGWFNLTTGLTLLPASIIFGELWQAVDPLAAFVFSAACAGSAALLLHLWVGAGEGARSTEGS
ncbi:MFS transporter [Accumulibacter sp.]|uniref:MFS transporter n=2 Tax=Accumulibacter sp. TaxID=2053492 RepID=UPI00262BFA7E|nr:MFS transporter [Accumulibacter sp.]MDS4054308.1 MFS transporter [Accumulibacter sp.]HMW81651.1 MFS transporter [Accumulibacter sp.]HND39240.1 MFS transporter [Accumulibacter sp.]HNG88380.1 MFS transporter [Accumulibacter sp.]HNI52651.1 MFS transporter [Accumulibacter sp.]